MPKPKSTWELLTYDDLRAYRDRCGFRSDAELADDLDVSVGSIAGWKKGVRAPSLRVQRAMVARMAGDPKPQVSEGTADLVKRLLSLAGEVDDPSALVEAAQLLLKYDSGS